MKTGGILFFGGAVLLVLGGLGALVFIGPLLKGQGGTFSNLLAVLVLGALPAAAGVLLMAAGARRGKLEREHEDRGFPDLATALARKHGERIGADAVDSQPAEPRRYVSARGYEHVLTALLARGREDHALAARELREALLYDPGSPYLRTLFADELLRQGSVSSAERELGNA